MTGWAFYDLERGAWRPPVPMSGLIFDLPTLLWPNWVLGVTSEGLTAFKVDGGPPRLLVPHPKNSTFTFHHVAGDGRTVYLLRVNESADIWMATPP